MIRDWLPSGKSAAVCLSIDDVHPGTSEDAYEAGGDLAAGSLGRVMCLQRRHAELKLTLCVTPEWRLKSLVPDSGWLRRVPWLKHHVHWTRLHPRDHFRIDRYPALVAFLNGLERCEVALHGLTHTHAGQRFAVEFQEQTVRQCVARVRRGLEIFNTAKLSFVRGFVPPAWNAPPSLIQALDVLGFQFLCSARDLQTKIAPDALTSMSGLHGVSLLYPQFVGADRVVHVTCNFQATSSFERAYEILDQGGVLHIKAHIFKEGGGHVMLDGLDDRYCLYLDQLFVELKRRFGDSLWWAHLSEVASRARLAA